MQYRSFGNVDFVPSALGFGAMRLPIVGGDEGKINESEATRMIHYAIEQGVNYIDTAYTYHKEQGEPFLGRILSEGYREKVKLATKLPTWRVKDSGDFDRYLDEQLIRLRTDNVDFYLLHALNKKSWSAARDLGVLNWAQQAISDGRVGHLGFSFHDELAVFKEIIDATDQWTFCQIQYNFMDVDYQAGSQGLKYAASKGLAVVIMEPLRGGQLARKIPQGVAKLWSMAQHKRTAVDWALQWVWNQPEVSLLLSGMSTMQQVEENVASANCSCPGVLSEEELALIDQVHAAYSGLSPIPCTNCKYCLPCPSGVNIPRILELYNSAIMFEDSQESRDDYQFLKEDERADRCSECLQCEELCPQSIAIPDWLKKANTLLSAAE